MRSVVALNKCEQKKLAALFPSIMEVNADNDGHGYKKIAVSVFDHWLSRLEASDLLADVSSEEQAHRDELHYSLNKKIISLTKCFTFRVRGRRGKEYVIFKRFVDSSAAHRYVKPSDGFTSNKFFFKLVLPEIQALYFEGYDGTNYLYYEDDGLLVDLLKWIKEEGLHVLNCK